jgi:hypothetical protein
MSAIQMVGKSEEIQTDEAIPSSAGATLCQSTDSTDHVQKSQLRQLQYKHQLRQQTPAATAVG